MDSNTLVERLRNYMVREKPLRDEAADLITRLTTDLTDLRHDLERAVARETQALTDLAAAVAERDALKMQVDWHEDQLEYLKHTRPDAIAMLNCRDAEIRDAIAALQTPSSQALGEHHG